MLLIHESIVRDLKNAHAQAIGFILSKTVRAFLPAKRNVMDCRAFIA
jgi:hypothetical protein